MFDRSAVVAIETDLGVVCFADESGHCLTFAVSLVVTQELLSVAHLFSWIDIMLNSWLLFVSGLGQRLQVIKSWRVLFVHLRTVHNQPYFVCTFVGPNTTFMLKPIWNGAESILWYWWMMRLVIFSICFLGSHHTV
jgi:hypothetical protein